MPFVEVFSRPGVAMSCGPAIKDCIREFASQFSSHAFKLNAEHFSFKFHEAHPRDELEQDVYIRITLRETPSTWNPRPTNPRQVGREQATRIAEIVSELQAPPTYLYVMVELQLQLVSCIGSASYDPLQHQYSILPEA